jgi:signal transduction histidine kinase
MTPAPANDERLELHALVARASQLVRRYRRAGRAEHHALRDEAQSLVAALDMQHPMQSAVQQTFALMRQIADDDGSRHKELVRTAELLAPLDVPRTGQRSRPASTSMRDADAWILDMFRATESAIPRETLVSEFAARYRRSRGITDSERHGGPWLFVFETETEAGLDGDRPPRLKAIEGLGVHPTAFAERCREHLPSWESDPFLGAALLEGQDVDAWYALAFGGSPLFNALLDVQRRFGGEANYWVSGVALPADGRHESRAVMVLYANAGDTLSPEPPPGIRQDMRLLTVLGLAWRQLEHQVRALRRISEADRRDMINLIAPGLMHHEIGFSMRTAYGQLYEQHQLLQRVADETGRDDVQLALDYAHGAAKLVLRLYQITNAFNNFDKRGQIETSDLNQVLAELKLLLHHRLGSAFTELNWDEPACAAQQLHTDVVLLSQALLNLINNALNALGEADTPPPRRVSVMLEDCSETSVALSVVNNGPPVAPGHARDIFRRGYTTRARGHGQGLYLARLVAHYLGGELTLLDKAALPPDFNVGFRFVFQRRLTAREGIGHVSE